MDTVTQPKIFISYAHADGETTVKDFWNNLKEQLKSPSRSWGEWDDKQILVGQDWDSTITQALEQGCNCCLLLVSDLFAKSSYVVEKEWPKTLARYEKQGIVFFPVVFGVLEGGLAALPEELYPFQVYWPTVSELYTMPPINVPHPDQVRLGYKDVKEQDAARDRFLSKLATQMNARFDEYLRSQAIKAQAASPSTPPIDAKQFVTNDSDEDTFAKAMFGSFSYEKRYQNSKSKGHYFPRQADAKLDECLGQNGWALIEGHPLAGKTRAVFEAIKRLMSGGKRVAVWPFKAPERSDQPLVLPTFPDADYRIVWIDDIDTRFRDLAKHGYGADDINRFLEQLASMRYILVATVRTGPAYHEFRHRFGLDDHLWDKLEAIPMLRLEGEEEKGFAAWYRASFGTSLPDKFDHHPGSLFLDLDAMRGRWENMEDIAKDHKLDVERTKDIMRALHVFYVMEAYRPGGEFREEDIRFYLRRKAEKAQTATAMGGAFAQALSRMQPSNDDWGKMIELLSQDQFHLGFLRQIGDALFTETAYLDYIVAPGGERNIVQTVKDNFSEEERRRLGLAFTRYNFGDVFRGNPPQNEKELENLVRKLKPLGLEREIVVWSQLLHLCPSLALAMRAMEKLRQVGVKPDVVTYTALLDKARTLNEGRAILADMRGDGIVPNVVTYNTLLTKAHTLAEGRAILADMNKNGITSSVVTYNALLTKTQTLEEGRTILADMCSDNIVPNVVTYTTLLDKAQTLEEGRGILADMRNDDVKLDVITYNTLLDKAPTLNEGRAILADMRNDAGKPDVVSYSILLNKAKTLEEGRTILAEMRNDGITPNVIVYTTLLGKAQTLEEGRTILAEMRNNSVKPEAYAYTTLLNKSKTLEEGRAILVEMRNDGVKPDVIAYSTLLKKVRTLDEGRSVLAEMRENGAKPDDVTYNTLLAKARTLGEGRAILAEMRNDGIRLDDVTYNTLLTKAQTLDEGRAILAEMRKDGIRPDTYTYSPLLKCANNVNDVEALLVAMKADGVAFSLYHLRAVTRKLEHDTTPAARQLWTQLKTAAEGG